MKVLVIGSGAREHALAWGLSQSQEVTEVFVSPGNAWTQELWPTDVEAIESQSFDLVVIGPDQALADGVADAWREKKSIPVFGPSQKASQIEWSKSFSKDVMKQAGVPTAEYRVVESEADAERLLKSLPWANKGWVLKWDGLALGKGVYVCESLDQGLQALKALSQFKNGNHKLVDHYKLVIEEKLSGHEVSWMALCDGTTFRLLDPVCDYKRLKDYDEGPNTGGMGAFSPVPEVEVLRERVESHVFKPVLEELSRRGTPFSGLLYAGLMIKGEKLWVLEFNARFGDPETQVLLPRWNQDKPNPSFYAWCEAVAKGTLSEMPKRVAFHPKHAVYVVSAAPGYPESPQKGIPLVAFPKKPTTDLKSFPVFSAGVSRAKDQDSGWQVSGGRVFGCLGLGQTRNEARQEAFEWTQKLTFHGAQARTDIGKANRI